MCVWIVADAEFMTKKKWLSEKQQKNNGHWPPFHDICSITRTQNIYSTIPYSFVYLFSFFANSQRTHIHTLAHTQRAQQQPNVTCKIADASNRINFDWILYFGSEHELTKKMYIIHFPSFSLFLRAPFTGVYVYERCTLLSGFDSSPTEAILIWWWFDTDRWSLCCLIWVL